MEGKSEREMQCYNFLVVNTMLSHSPQKQLLQEVWTQEEGDRLPLSLLMLVTQSHLTVLVQSLGMPLHY